MLAFRDWLRTWTDPEFRKAKFGVRPQFRQENKKDAGVDLSRKMLSEARVIAKGKRIRDVRRLVAQYGGRTSRWIKKSSPQFRNRRQAL